jgi:hypothetical protein
MKYDVVDAVTLFRILIDSVRDLNRGIVQLKWVVKEKLVTDEARKQILLKLENMMNTRMCLIYSVYDIRQRFIDALSDKNSEVRVNKKFAIETLFAELKNI